MVRAEHNTVLSHFDAQKQPCVCAWPISSRFAAYASCVCVYAGTCVTGREGGMEGGRRGREGGREGGEGG